METRKIQSVGGGTYTVSLPKEWANAQGITSGDVVGLHEHIDGVLAIQAPEDEQSTPSQITVQLTRDETDAIEHVLRAAYAGGTKEVRLENPEGFDADQQRIVNRVARDLTGVSVVEDSETVLAVRTLLDTEEVSVTQSVRQLRFVVLSMQRDAWEAVSAEGDPGRLGKRDDQADRLHAMITRSFARGVRRLEEVDALGVSRPELFELWATTRELERVGDHAVGIGTAARLTDGRFDEDLLADCRELAETARSIVSDAVTVVIDDTDVETAQQVLAARDEFRTSSDAFEKRTESDRLARIGPVLDRVRRTAEHGGNIAEIGLRRAIRTGDLTSPGGVGRDPSARIE